MAPKYKQRGYMDDYDNERQPRRRDGGEPVLTSIYKILICPKCGMKNQLLTDARSDTVCEKCKTSLHCCRACQFFAAGKPFDCALPIETEIPRKDAANQCPRFAGNYIREAPRHITSSDARKALDKLFKK